MSTVFYPPGRKSYHRDLLKFMPIETYDIYFILLTLVVVSCLDHEFYLHLVSLLWDHNLRPYVFCLLIATR